MGVEEGTIEYHVKHFMLLDDEISKMNIALRELRLKKTVHSDEITKYMIEHNQVSLETSSSFIRVSSKKKPRKVNKEVVTLVLNETLGNDNNSTTEKIIDNLYNNDDDGEEIRKITRTKKNSKKN